MSCTYRQSFVRHFWQSDFHSQNNQLRVSTFGSGKGYIRFNNWSIAWTFECPLMNDHNFFFSCGQRYLHGQTNNANNSTCINWKLNLIENVVTEWSLQEGTCPLMDDAAFSVHLVELPEKNLYCWEYTFGKRQQLYNVVFSPAELYSWWSGTQIGKVAHPNVWIWV